MTQPVLLPRSQKVKVKARKSQTFRLNSSSGIRRVVRLFRSNKENIAADPRDTPDNVYIVPHVQPGAELYPSSLDFTDFMFGLHRSSDRYPSPEPVSPFLRSHTATSSYDESITPEIDHLRTARRVCRETSREEAVRATDDLQNLLREKYPPGEEGDFEAGLADVVSGLPAELVPRHEAALLEQVRGTLPDETEEGSKEEGSSPLLATRPTHDTESLVEPGSV